MTAPAHRRSSTKSRSSSRSGSSGSPAGLDLGALDIRPGEVRRVELRVPQAPLQLGGQTYSVEPHAPVARLEIQGAQGGMYLKLRLRAEVHGPCFRCLEDARVRAAIDVSEYHEPAGADELQSDYVDAGRVDVERWARDALVFALPAKILCRPDCAGLCPRCGVRREPGMDHECGEYETDPRWEKLRDWGA
jgi:uncharacterized protein